MRVLMINKANEQTEASILPTPEVVAGMGELIGRMMQAGQFLAGEGLAASSKGVRLNFAGGKRTITPGPFPKGNELTAGLAILRVHTLAEATDWATRYAEIVGDSEIDVRPVHEPWDIGAMPKPEGLTTVRYMWVHKADRSSEAGVALSEERKTRLGQLMGEMKKAGVLLSAERLVPSAEAVRVRFQKGNRTVTDGPFAESKELIAGFCMLQVKSATDALEWTEPFARVIGDVELDIHPLYESAT